MVVEDAAFARRGRRLRRTFDGGDGAEAAGGRGAEEGHGECFDSNSVRRGLVAEEGDAAGEGVHEDVEPAIAGDHGAGDAEALVARL